MIIELIRYRVTEGQESAFETACRHAAKSLTRSSHCLGYSLMRATATTERNRYAFTLYWDTPDGHYIGFRQSEDFVEFSRHLEPFATMVEEDQHYRKTGVELTKPSFVRLSGGARI